MSLILLTTSCSNLLPNKYYVVPNEKHKITTNTISWAQFKTMASRDDFSGYFDFSPGLYSLATPLIIKGSGRVTLVAHNDSVFVGDYSGGKVKNSSGIILKRGNVDFYNFTFKNSSNCIRGYKNTTLDNIYITNLKAQNIHSCILIERHSNVTALNWNISNLHITDYYRVGIRISGHNTSKFKLSNFFINGQRTHKKNSHCYKGGIQILEGAHDITIQSGKIINNVGSCGKGYQQGDAIEADNKQGVPYNLWLSDLVLSNSGDSNLDLKANNVLMVNIESKSTGNTRFAYKLWSYDDYTCSSCNAIGNFYAYITLNSAEAVFSKFKTNSSDKEISNLLLTTISNKASFLTLD